MSNYAPIEWVPIEPPAPRVRSQVAGTRLSRWSVFFGIQSVLFGFILPVPILAIVFGIVGLCRGTTIPGRATVGIVFGWSGLTFWGSFIAICIWSMNITYP